MNTINPFFRLTPLALLLALALPCKAERLLGVDATQPTPVPLTGHLKMGAARDPQGHTLTVTSQYLALDGKPWLPVAGEYHYARSLAADWDNELRKMKSAGVDIVSSYVLWNFHETQPGKFDWSADRDLRRFVQTAGKAGLKVILRIGPWAHAEARYGGLPDWVVNTMPTRTNDPAYLRASGRFFQQVAAQIKGLQWKDSGPVIGVQFENELDHTADGEAHIAALKKLGLEAGLDLPLYTVFGTSSYKYPPGEVTPTFGGYPDRPWGTEEGEIAPKGVYAFLFDSRVSGDIGQQEGALGIVSRTVSREDSEKARVPFLGAEFGGGLPQMYRRRTLLGPHDLTSLHAVQLGSGTNMMGYYLFHGGRNPRPGFGSVSLEESTLSGGFNDTPQINYDFEAPLGPDGQQREHLGRMRRLNQFINAFGERLAPMTTRKPDVVPANSSDLTTPRYAVRAQGNRAFLFVNNHVRQAPMAEFKDVRFSIKLPGQTVQLPRQPMAVEPSDYFVWPVNFDLDGTQLVYATAQPVTRLDAGADGVVYVFAQTTAQQAEFAFAADDKVFIDAPQASLEQGDGQLVYGKLRAGTTPVLTIKRPGARPVRVLLLDEQQSRNLAVVDFGGQRRLLLTEQQVWNASEGLALRSFGNAEFRLAMFPAPKRAPHGALPVKTLRQDGLFQVYGITAPAYEGRATVELLREAQPVPPVLKGGQAKAALQPVPEVWAGAATWQLKYAVPELPKGALDDILIKTDFVGDVGRIFAGEQLVDDWYYGGGESWELGLRALPSSLRRQPLSIAVMPLRADAPIYLPASLKPAFAGKSQIAALNKVSVIPVYKTVLQP